MHFEAHRVIRRCDSDDITRAAAMLAKYRLCAMQNFTKDLRATPSNAYNRVRGNKRDKSPGLVCARTCVFSPFVTRFRKWRYYLGIVDERKDDEGERVNERASTDTTKQCRTILNINSTSHTTSCPRGHYDAVYRVDRDALGSAIETVTKLAEERRRFCGETSRDSDSRSLSHSPLSPLSAPWPFRY